MAALVGLPYGARAEHQSLDAWISAWHASAAITNDPSDRARYQARVVERGIRLGVDPARLDRMAREIEDWQRYETLAKLSSAYLRSNDIDTARKLAFESLYRAPLFPPDKRDRIIASALWALALTGELAEIEAIKSRYQPEDRMRSIASAAFGLGLIRAGRHEEGLAALDDLAGAHPFDLSGLRSRALELAAEGSAPNEFDSIFRAAWIKSGEEENYRSIDERLRLIELAARAGVQIDLSELAGEVSRMIDRIPAPRLARCAQWAGLAVAWGRAGRAAEARSAADTVRSCAADLELIERPALFAIAAAGLAHAGLTTEARAWFSGALKDAEQLINPRPRAIAMTNVYLAMADAGIDPEPHERLPPIATSADP